MGNNIRVRGEFGVPWEDFKQMINDAKPPAGTYVCRGPVGNLVLTDADGEFRGFIDHTDGGVDPCGTWSAS